MVSRFDIKETEQIAEPNRFAVPVEPVPGADRFGLPQTVINGSQNLTSILPDEGRLLADEIFALTDDPDAVKTDLINTSYWSEKLGMRFNDAFDLKSTIGTQLFGTEDISRNQILQGIRQMEVERFRPPEFIATEEPGLFSRMWHSIRDGIVTPRDIEGQIARGPFTALLLGREEFPDLEQLHRKTFKQSVKDAYAQAGNRQVKSLAGRAQLIGDIGTKLGNLLRSNTPESQQLKNDLSEWGEYMAMAADTWHAENPESQLQIQPGTGFLGTTAQYILHPENILQGSLETVPMLLTALLGHITGSAVAEKVGFGAKFLPWAGRVAGIAEPEIGEEYTNARAQGLDVENALAQSYTKAYTRAVIEEWVLGEKIKIFKGQFGKAASTGFAKKTTDLLLGGKRAYIRGAIEEGTQSVTDRFWEMVWGDTEKWFDGGIDGLVSRLTEGASEAAAVGGLLEMGMASAFAVSGQVVAQAGRVDVKGQIRRINQIRKDIKQNQTLDDQSKEEIDVVLDEKVEQVTEAAVAPEAAKVVPSRPIVAPKAEGGLEIKKAAKTTKVFHGSDVKVEGPIKPSKSGFVFVGRTEEFAKGFGKNIEEFEIPEDKILKLRNPDGSFTEAGKEITDKLGFDNAGEFTKDALPEAEKRGFLAIQRGQEIITRAEVLNKAPAAAVTEGDIIDKPPEVEERIRPVRRDIAKSQNVAVKEAVIFRDMGPKEFERLLETRTEKDAGTFPSKTFFANTENLALGQGTNTGVLIEFFANNEIAQDLRISKAKPGLEFVAAQGEFELSGITVPKTQFDSIKSITLNPATAKTTAKLVKQFAGNLRKKSLQVRLDRLVEQGWVKETLKDGSVKYTKQAPAVAITETAFEGEAADAARVRAQKEAERTGQQKFLWVDNNGKFHVSTKRESMTAQSGFSGQFQRVSPTGEIGKVETITPAKAISEPRPPISAPTKAEKQVIDAKKFNADIKAHEAQVKGEEGIVEIETEDVDDATEPLGRTMTPDWYESNSKVYKKTILEKGTDLAKKTIKGLDFLAGVTSTRLRNISPELGRKLRRHEFNVMTRTTEQTKRVEPFLRATTKRKLGKDFAAFDIAFKNSEAKIVSEFAKKHGFTRELREVRQVLDELFNQGNAVGLEIDYRKEYFPRVVKDTKGFLEFFQKGDDWSIVRTVIEDKETARGRALTESERAAAVNTLLRGYRTSALTLTAPGAAKARTVQEVTPEINQFYQGFSNSLTNYIEIMNEKIASREFFGRQSKEITNLRAQQSRLRTRLAKLSTRQGRQKPADADKEIRLGFFTGTLTQHISRANDQFEEVTEKLDRMGADDLSNTIGQYVLELVVNDDIKPSQEKEVRDLLMGRFDPKSAHGLIGEIIPITYIDVLSQITNALTQLEELALAFYRSPVGFIPAATKAAINLNEITLEDIGVTTVAQELTDADSRKILSTLLSITQFKRFDAFAKQTFINAALTQLQQQSKTEGMTFNDRLERVFGEETDQVVKDLKAGEQTEDVKFLIASQLLDIQPIAKSEMPEAYNRAGNLRILYQLKTFMIKQFDFVRTEALQDMRNPIADPTRFMRGFGRLVWLSFSLALFGAGRDLLVDFVTGRPFDLSDSVVDTFLRRIFFSRFQYSKATKEGIGTAILEGLVPPTKTIDAVTKDIKKVSKNDEDGLDVWRSVPIVGELYFWWFGRGREKALREQAKARREKVRRKPLSTKRKALKTERRRLKTSRKPL